jgi:hypothetical protein
VNRLPVLMAIGCVITVASWWFMQLSLLTDINAAAVGDVSLRAMRALLLLQLVSISLFAALWLSKSEAFAAAQSATILLSAILPAWPLLAMLSLATGLSAVALAKTEMLVLGAGVLVTLFARAIQSVSVSAEAKRLLQSSLGLVAAAITWSFRAHWLQWITI